MTPEAYAEETGLQAQVINEMMEFWGKDGAADLLRRKAQRIRRPYPLQVFVGAALGILIAVLYCLFLG